MSSICDKNIKCFNFLLFVFVLGNPNLRVFSTFSSVSALTNSKDSSFPHYDHSAGAGLECTYGAGCSDVHMALVQMQRRKADVAAKILKAIGHSKPPKIKPEMRKKFFPLAEELKAEMQRINEKLNLDEINKQSDKEKNIFIAMETDGSALGGFFDIPFREIKSSPLARGKILIKFPVELGNYTIKLSNTWNSENVSLTVSSHVEPRHVYLNASFFIGASDAQQRTRVLLNFTRANNFNSSEPVPLSFITTSFSPAPTYLSLSLLQKTTFRSRRGSSHRCSDLPDHVRGSCCLEEFHVNFIEMGYNFVIAPPTVQVNRCRGVCSVYDPSMMANFGAILRALSPASRKAGDGPENYHCCAPSRFSSISILYIEKGDGTATMRQVPDTVVESCHCI